MPGALASRAVRLVRPRAGSWALSSARRSWALCASRRRIYHSLSTTVPLRLRLRPRSAWNVERERQVR